MVLTMLRMHRALQVHRVLLALWGALGFLSRVPVGRDEDAWRAFCETPVAFPLAGYLLGGLLALPLVVSPLSAPLPAPTLAAAFVAWVVVLTGVNHADGLADLGDAAAVHGDAATRRAAMKDTVVGVGGVLAVGVVLLALALAGLGLADLSRWAAVWIVVAAEVGAKTGVAALVCLGTPSHEGMGAALADSSGPGGLPGVLAAATPAVALGAWLLLGDVGPAVALVVAGIPVLGALLAAAAVGAWARRYLGGVGGDVFGATNELARVVALHAGVIAWTLS